MNDAHDLLPLQAEVFTGGPDGENGVAPLYTRLRTMILDGAFPPGSMLPRSSWLSRWVSAVFRCEKHCVCFSKKD